MDRHKSLLIISRRLLIFAAISLLATAILFAATFFFGKRFLISWFCFECGIIGGFVSIQQRLWKIEDEELALLSESWATIMVIPIYGGIFALVLYMLFLSGLLEGNLFPDFGIPEFNNPPTTENLRDLFTKAYPKTASDFAKFAVWSFVAGFSERFVPQIIGKMTSKQ